MVAMGMGKDDGRQTVDSQRLQLAGDLGLGRALVYQHRTLRHLQQDGVALADVEDGHPQAARRQGWRLLADRAPGQPQSCRHGGNHQDAASARRSEA